MDEMRVSPIPERARRLAARIKERYDSQEFQAFWAPAKRGILAGESDGLREWARGRVGKEPDFVLGEYIRPDEVAQATPRETFQTVDALRERLTAEKYEADELAVLLYDERAKKIGALKEIKEALGSDWPAEVARAILIAAAESEHGYPTTLSKIDYRLKRDNAFLRIKGPPGDEHPEVRALKRKIKEAWRIIATADPHSPRSMDARRAQVAAETRLEEIRNLAYPLGYEGLKDPEGTRTPVEILESLMRLDEPPLQRFQRQENRRIERMIWRRYAYEGNEARLSPRELKVFRLALYLHNQEIAEKIGGSNKQIGEEKRRAVDKVHNIVGRI